MKIQFSRKQLCIPYSLFLLIFVIIPLFVVIYYAFTDKITGKITFANFIDFFQNTTAISTLFISIWIAFLTTFFSLLIAYPVAYILAKSNYKKKSILLLLFIMPMWINFVLRVNAIKEILELFGMLGKTNFLNTIIGMVYDFLPFMILPLYITLIKIDKSLLEAAEDLGGNKLNVFTKITFPLSMPGIVSGITMVFMPTMTCYVISESLGQGKITIIGKLIENSFINANNWNFGSAIAIILLFIIFASMLFTGKFKDENLESRGTGLW
jgi:spermidine/putrescine transport system permease protein